MSMGRPRQSRPAGLPLRAMLTAPLLLAAGACSSIVGDSPAPAWHSLVASAAADATADTPTAVPPTVVPPHAPAAAGQRRAISTLAVARISVPDEVDRQPLVLSSAGERRLLDGQRWIEPLKTQLPRALALALAAEVPGLQTSAFPAAAPDAARRLVVDVQRFELVAGSADDASKSMRPHAQLRVLWALRDGAPADAAPGSGADASRTSATPMQLFDIAVPATDASPRALVAAMREAVRLLAQQVGATLSQPSRSR